MRVSRLLLLPLLAVAVGTAGTTWAATHKVFPGESIQAAVDAASAGDKVIVYAGTYQEPHSSGPAVRITKPLTLMGKVTAAQRAAGEVVKIIPNPGQSHGIVVEPENEGDPTIVGVQIKGITVEGFPGMGIWLRYVEDFKIEKNVSANNEENGIFPTLSANGMVKRNVSYGSADSALWVEASENVRVLQNEIYDSVTGLEITVSNNIEVSKNNIYNNVVGVGLYHPSGASLPPLAVMQDWVITKNHIHGNNRVNDAPDGSMAASLPSGGGMLVLGVDRVFAEDNLIENNNFYGISVIDYCVAVAGSEFDCNDYPPEVESAPDQNIFSKNELVNNGTAPDMDHPLAPYAADITYIMTEDGHINRFCGNEFTTKSFPFYDPIELAKCG